jgi:hypothetical protein
MDTWSKIFLVRQKLRVMVCYGGVCGVLWTSNCDKFRLLTFQGMAKNGEHTQKNKNKTHSAQKSLK